MSNCIYCGIEFVPHKLHPHAKTCSSSRCRQDYKNEWGRKNPSSKQNWVLRNPTARAEASKKYTQKNKTYYAEYQTLRSRHLMCAKPKWLDEFQLFFIEELYDLARLRKQEVDHIVPLKNSKVCGLHVPWNLQLLTRSENAKKSNKFNEDVVGVLENE